MWPSHATAKRSLAYLLLANLPDLTVLHGATRCWVLQALTDPGDYGSSMEEVCNSMEDALLVLRTGGERQAINLVGAP